MEDLEIGSHKTKSLNTILEGNELTNALFVDGDLDEANSNFSVACKNVPNVQLLPSDMANV